MHRGALKARVIDWGFTRVRRLCTVWNRLHSSYAGSLRLDGTKMPQAQLCARHRLLMACEPIAPRKGRDNGVQSRTGSGKEAVVKCHASGCEDEVFR